MQHPGQKSNLGSGQRATGRSLLLSARKCVCARVCSVCVCLFVWCDGLCVCVCVLLLVCTENLLVRDGRILINRDSPQVFFPTCPWQPGASGELGRDQAHRPHRAGPFLGTRAQRVSLHGWDKESCSTGTWLQGHALLSPLLPLCCSLPTVL